MGDRPGEGLLHPFAVLCLAALLLNDHVLKDAWPSWFTGKLSDLAGLAFAPVLAVALFEIASAALRRGGDWRASRSWLLGVVVFVGVAFAAAKVLPPAGDAYRTVLGWAKWPLQVVGALLGGEPVPGPGRVRLTEDPTDLFALPALAVGYRLSRPRLRTAGSSPSRCRRRRPRS